MGNKLEVKVRNTQKRTLNDVTTTQRSVLNDLLLLNSFVG